MQENNLKVPYALKDGKLVYVADIAKGENGCICPKCKNEVRVRKGPIRAHHFYHLNNTIDCDGGLETIIHLLAKETFEEHKILSLPKIEINRNNVVDKSLKSIMDALTIETIPLSPERKDVSFVNVESERLIENGRKPDAIATEKNGGKLYVEFKYSHAVEDSKQKEFNELHLNCVEIDISDFELLVPDEDNNYTDEDNKQKMLQFLRQRTDKYEWISFNYSPDSVIEKIKAEKQHVYELAKNAILRNNFTIPPLKINNNIQFELLSLMHYFNIDTFHFKNVTVETYKDQTLPFDDVLLENLNITIHHKPMVNCSIFNDITIEYDNLSVEKRQNIKKSSFCLEVNINKLLFTKDTEQKIHNLLSNAENYRWFSFNDEFVIQELKKRKEYRENQERIEREKELERIRKERLEEIEREKKERQKKLEQERIEQQKTEKNKPNPPDLITVQQLEDSQKIDDYIFNIYLIYAQNEIKSYSNANITEFINNITEDKLNKIQNYLCEIEKLIDNNRKEFFPLILDIYHGISQRVSNFKLEKISKLKYIGSI